MEPHRVDALAQSINKVLTAGVAEISLLSGSTPPKRTNYETHIRPRAEVQLWEAVRQTCNHELGYGDYGVVHPIPPTPKGLPLGPNPYIHYTVPGATLSIARQIPGRKGAPPPGSSERYFLEVADELVRRPEFAGPKFSWGDRILHSCRSKPAMPLGKSTKWISIATSHHLAHLSKRLDSS